MIVHRDGEPVVLCDSCYRRPPAGRRILVETGRRSLRTVDRGTVYGEGKTEPIVLAFCDERCRDAYQAPTPTQRR